MFLIVITIIYISDNLSNKLNSNVSSTAHNVPLVDLGLYSGEWLRPYVPTRADVGLGTN